MKIAGKEIESNTKEYISMKITTDLDGGDINVPVHVVAGDKAGPTLALLSMLHGSEWGTIEVIKRLVEQTHPDELNGTLVAVPVGNPVAFGNYLTRNTPDESDNADLNRVFPGNYTWIAELIASKLAKEVLANSDYLIDFHSFIWGSVLGATMAGTDFPDDNTVKECRAMAEAFGYPCIHLGKVMSVFPGPRSSFGYFGGVLGRPGIGVEIGGLGFDEELEQKWVGMNVTGTKNVMMHLDMLGGEPELPEEYLVFEKRWRVNPSVGGILTPRIPSDSLMREVEEDELLGEVVSPYSFEVLEELRSPGKGILFMSARMYPVRPGDWAFAVIDTEDENTKWISRT
jgi:hypothetical protein